MKKIVFFFLILFVACTNSKEIKQVDHKPSQEVIDLNNKAVSIFEAQLQEDLKDMFVLREALSYLNEAITLDSTYVYSYLNKISIYKHLEIYDSAAIQYKIVSKIDTKKPEYILGEGIMLEKIGDHGRANEKYLAAIQSYQKLIEENPKDVDLKINQVFFYLLLQGREEAISHLDYISSTSEGDKEKIDRMLALIEDFQRQDFIDNF
jgi:tetratricopeptide (TPR) repeat protein